MKSKSLKLTLGQRDIVLPPFILRQIRDIDIALKQPSDPTGSNFDLAIDVVAIALKREMPEVTPESVRDMPATGDQLLVALRKIIAFANTGEDDEEVPPAPAPEPATAA